MCAVFVNGEQLTMTKGETELEMIPYVEGGEMVILWQKHREGLGNAIEITTGQSYIHSHASVLAPPLCNPCATFPCMSQFTWSWTTHLYSF